MSPLFDHRERIAHSVAAAERAVRDLWLNHRDLASGFYHTPTPDRALVADLIRNAPEAVIAACERLAPHRTETPT